MNIADENGCYTTATVQYSKTDQISQHVSPQRENQTPCVGSKSTVHKLYPAGALQARYLPRVRQPV